MRSQFFDQRRWDFFQEARGDAGFGQVGAVSAAVDGAGQDQLVHGAGHADVAEAAFFFDVFRDEHGAGMRKKSFFEAAEEDQGKLQSLGGVQAHQRDLGAGVVVVGVGDERGVVQEFVQSFGAVARVHGGVDQFAQVLDAGESLGRVLVFEQLDVAGTVDQEFQDVGSADGGSRKGIGRRANLRLRRPVGIS